MLKESQGSDVRPSWSSCSQFVTELQKNFRPNVKKQFLKIVLIGKFLFTISHLHCGSLEGDTWQLRYKVILKAILRFVPLFSSMLCARTMCAGPECHSRNISLGKSKESVRFWCVGDFIKTNTNINRPSFRQIIYCLYNILKTSEQNLNTFERTN